MHGHGYAPPQPKRPPTALLIAIRVLFVALALLSFGMLAWGTMLRIAILRRRRLDWLLFWVSLAIAITALVVIGEYGPDAGAESAEQDEMTALDMVFLPLLLGLAIGVPTHYLVADIRHYQEPRTGWAPPPYAAPTVPYGLPPQPGQTPHTSRTPHTSQTPQPFQRPGYGYPPVPPQPQPRVPPQPQPPVPPHSPADKPRIDQVRAELDELSDYLRKEQGR
ncbi:hypothetical protein ABT010_21255 [Streptomyces sp. NPDC002668]|uniref:hypothetical protein n=1 Tax=Streptomyces sp. NPDC002668 TaxID=3154422 RepID=UPI0033174DBE